MQCSSFSLLEFRDCLTILFPPKDTECAEQLWASGSLGRVIKVTREIFGFSCPVSAKFLFPFPIFWGIWGLYHDYVTIHSSSLPLLDLPPESL